MVGVVELHHILLEVTGVHVPQHNIVHVLVVHVHLHVDLVQVGDAGVRHGVLKWVGRQVRASLRAMCLLHVLALLLLLQDQLAVVEDVVERDLLVGGHAQDGAPLLQLAAVLALVEHQRLVHAHQRAELALVVLHVDFALAQFNDGVRAAHTDVGNAHVRLTPAPDRDFLPVLVKDQDVQCAGQVVLLVERLEHDVIFAQLGVILLNQVDIFCLLAAVDLFEAFGVGHGAQLAGEILVVVGGAVLGVLELQLGLEPHPQTVQVYVLHAAGALAHGEQRVVARVELIQTDSARHAVVLVIRLEHFAVLVIFVEKVVGVCLYFHAVRAHFAHEEFDAAHF